MEAGGQSVSELGSDEWSGAYVVLVRVLDRYVADRPLRVTVCGKLDVGDRYGIVAGLNPAGTEATIADRTLTAEAHKVDFGVPLTVPRADRTLRVERAVARLKRDDVECVRTVRSAASNDRAGMWHHETPVLFLSLEQNVSIK